MRSVFAIVLLLAASASADVSPAVKKYLGGAAALFENLDYERALVQLGRAKSKSTGPEDDAAIALYEGTVLAEMGDPRAANMFVLALGIDPDATLPFVVSPRVQQVFDKAKANVTKLVKRPDKEPEPAPTPAPEPKPEPKLEPSPPPPTPPLVVSQPAPAQPSSSGFMRKLSFIPGGLGIASTVTGVVLRILADGIHTSLVTGAPMSSDDARNQVVTGKMYQTVGYLLIGVGVAAIAAAVAMFIAG